MRKKTMYPIITGFFFILFCNGLQELTAQSITMVYDQGSKKNFTEQQSLGYLFKKDNDKSNIPVEIFGGYSYLRGDFGNEMTGFPAGAHISALYNLSPHIATGINASTHSKKEGDIKYSRSFIMIEGRYAFQDVNAIDQKFIADIHVLVGYGGERVKYSAGGNSYTSKGSGPAFGTGLSGVIMITTKTGVKAEADYIGVKYKNTDGLNSNLRFSGGLWLRF